MNHFRFQSFHSQSDLQMGSKRNHPVAGYDWDCHDLGGQEFTSATAEESCDTRQSLQRIQRMVYPAAATCIILLAILAACYSLYFCKPVMLPMIGAFLLNFLFSPIVARLNKWGIPNFAAALTVLGLVLSIVVVGLAFAYAPAKSWIADRQKNLEIVREKLDEIRKPLATVEEVSREIDKIGKGDTDSEDQHSESSQSVPNASSIDDRDHSTASSPRNSPRPQIPTAGIPIIDISSQRTADQPKPSSFKTEDGKQGASTGDKQVIPVEVQQPSISNRIFSTTGDVLTGLALMLVLLFYLLSAGDRLLEKSVQLMPTLKDKKRMVELSRAIESSVSDYLTTTTLINFGLGVVIGTGLWLLGIPNPILWGAMAMLLNFFPFIGALMGAIVVFLVAVISFDSIAYSLWAPIIYLGVNLVEANFITPVLLGHSVSLHPAWLMIFFVVVSWVWGLGGAIVAVPLLAVIKISCDHIEPLVPLGRFLGR